MHRKSYFVILGIYLTKRCTCPLKADTYLGPELVGRCLVRKGAEAIAAGPADREPCELIMVCPRIVCTCL